MLVFSIISILVGIGIFILGMSINGEFIIIIGGSFVAMGIFFILYLIASHGKSTEEKQEIFDDMIKQYRDGMSRSLDYRTYKMTMGDRINKDIENDISNGINKSSRH